MRKMGNINSRLKKVYELALHGVGGEKETAKEILDNLLKKYALSFDDLSDEVIKNYTFEYHGQTQKTLLRQIIYKVTNSKKSCHDLCWTHSGRTCRTQLGADCTEAQKAEIEFLFDFYNRLYEKEVKFFLTAFIQKHKLFGDLQDEEKGTTLSHEEYLKISLLMEGLSDSSPLKQIECC